MLSPATKGSLWVKAHAREPARIVVCGEGATRARGDAAEQNRGWRHPGRNRAVVTVERREKVLLVLTPPAGGHLSPERAARSGLRRTEGGFCRFDARHR